MDRELLAQKINFRFAKRGAAIYLSHLDLLRHFSRALRRADLRPRLTAGFNPRPRLVFPHPLPLGVASVCETVEIEFCEEQPLAKIFAALKNADGGVVEFLGAEAMRPVKSGNAVLRCDYEITGFAAPEKLDAPVAEMLAAVALPVMRGHAEKTHSVDIRPYLAAIARDGEVIKTALLHTASGAGRLDDIAKWLAEKVGDDWREWRLQKTAVYFKTN
ncbi:hypothetical protein FACS1894139_11610 [Planctomycetales bacterium]|nr:hypothetical protein FACS1894108_05260 [Planctomycetales bacterium]GHT06248.1 hypothetical protein FACS1894139_11610 [Planctomycetales bacterium]